MAGQGNVNVQAINGAVLHLQDVMELQITEETRKNWDVVMKNWQIG